MKKLSLVLGLPVFALACSNNTSENNSAEHMKMEASSNINDPNAVVDPVCHMTQDDIAYTDFSVYQQDTVWFCSPHCKEEFDKEPGKYVKN